MGSAQCELLRTIWHALFGAPLRFFGGEVAGRGGGRAWLCGHRSQQLPGARSKSTVAKSVKSTPLRRNSWRFVWDASLRRTGGFLVQSGSTLNRFGRDSDKSHPQPAWARNLDGLGITGSLRSPPFCFWGASTGSLRSPLSSSGGGRTDSLRSPGDGARAVTGGEGERWSARGVYNNQPLSQFAGSLRRGKGAFGGGVR